MRLTSDTTVCSQPLAVQVHPEAADPAVLDASGVAPPPCAPRLPRSRQSRGRRSANRTAPPDGGAMAGARLGPGRPLGAANLKAQVAVLIAMPSPGRARGIRAGGQGAGSAELNFGLVVV